MNRKSKRRSGVVGLATCGLLAATACDSNPTLDPQSQLKAQGRVFEADGAPVTGLRVDLVRFFDDNRIPAFKVQPSVDDLFGCTSGKCDLPELNLQAGHVGNVRTDSSGAFEFRFTGQDVAVVGGRSDAKGNVEGSNLVIVARDPADDRGRAGVFTRDHVFSGADFSWDAGDLEFWDASAEVTVASTSGMAEFSWRRLSPEPTGGRNFYRLEIGGQNTPRLIVRCEAGASDVTLGGCASKDGGRLAYQVSMYSLYNYYSDNGQFTAYVTGEGVNYRFRAKFAPPPPLPAPTGTPVGIAGIWAVGSGTDQNLKGTSADDGDVRTTERITNAATAIYVKLDAGSLISDAGILGSTVKKAYEACVTIETNTSAFDDVAAAKAATQGWAAKGRFCGGNGSDSALSAMVNFTPKQATPWLRFVISPTDAEHAFVEVGEVAAFSSTN